MRSNWGNRRASIIGNMRYDMEFIRDQTEQSARELTGHPGSKRRPQKGRGAKARKARRK